MLKSVLFFFVSFLVTVPVLTAADPDKDAGTKARADLAGKILEIAYTPATLRDSFTQFLNPALVAMKGQGMPDAARDDVRRAFIQWFDEDIKWTEIKPKLVDLYVRAFTEDELKGLLSLYQQPLGAKILAKMPTVLQQGALIGQQYYSSKEDSLNARLAPIMQRYKK